MKILSIDTASDICGVSILDNTTLIINLDNNTGRTHSENLMPMIQKAFSKSNLKLNNIDLIVCDIGPGSFTGIRIGVATVKAFHDSLNIPCIGISSLESLAYNIKDSIKENELICSIIDCKNNNCYFSLYKKNNNVLNILIEPQAETISDCLAILESYYTTTFNNTSINFVGDGSYIYKDIIKKTFPNSCFANPNSNILSSFSLGIAGLDKFSFVNCSDNEILPLYLKKPQAQRQLEEKQETLKGI